MSEIIFSKRTAKYELLYFDTNFVFWGTALGHFSQSFFLMFCRGPTMVADIFTRYS